METKNLTDPVPLTTSMSDIFEGEYKGCDYTKSWGKAQQFLIGETGTVISLMVEKLDSVR